MHEFVNHLRRNLRPLLPDMAGQQLARLRIGQGVKGQQEGAMRGDEAAQVAAAGNQRRA